MIGGELFNFWLGIIPHRENCLCGRLIAHAIEKVGLVFILVFGSK